MTGHILRFLLLVPLAGGYLLLAYLTTATAEPSTLGALVAILPLICVALLMAWRAHHRHIGLGIWAAAMLALLVAWPIIESRFAWVYFIQHVGIFLLLAIAFGRTLAGGEEPMVTRFARMVHGTGLAPVMLRYTRAVTLLWTVFFIAMATTSTLLFGLGDLTHWWLFANLLSPLLVAATFAGEFAVRRLVLPPGVRTSLIDSIRASIDVARQSRPPAL